MSQPITPAPAHRDYCLDAEHLEQWGLLREAAVANAVAACEAHDPRVFARFGAAGRLACAEDIGHHLDFVRISFETGDLTPFIAYLGWLSEVLSARGIPTSGLPVSLEALALFFSRRWPGQAGDTVGAAFLAGRDALTTGIAPAAIDDGQLAVWDEADAYMHAALNGDRHTLQRHFDAALSRSDSLLLSELHVVQPALYGVGHAWQRNQASVAQEHLATALSLTLMAQASANATYADETGQRVLLACAAGNQHSVGLRMVADAFELRGWESQCLGANLPAQALLTQARAFKPDVIALSASLPQQLRDLRGAVATLRQQLGPSCPLIGVGGQVFNRFPLLAQSMDALFLGRHAGEAPDLALRALAASP